MSTSQGLAFFIWPKQKVSVPRIELGIFCVLSRRHNQLDHTDPVLTIWFKYRDIGPVLRVNLGQKGRGKRIANPGFDPGTFRL